MEAMRQSWTDDRLDALSEKVDRRFDEVSALRVEMKAGFDLIESRRAEDLTTLRSETKAGFDLMESRRLDDVAALRAEMKSGFDVMNARFDSLQRVMLQASVVVIVTLIGLLLGVNR